MNSFLTYFFSYTIVQGIVLFLILFHKSKSKPELKWLAILVLSFSYITFISLIYWKNAFLKFPHVVGTLTPIMFLLGPSYYLFVKTALESPKKDDPIYPHFIPFLGLLLINLPIFILNAAKKIILIQTAPGAFELIFNRYVEPILYIGSCVIYWVVIYSKYNKLIMSHKNTRNWFGYIHGLFGAFILGLIAYFMMSWTHLITSERDYFISAFMWLMIVFITIYGLLNQKYFDENIQGLLAISVPTDNIKIKIDEEKSKMRQLKDLEKILQNKMDHLKWYIDPELSLDKLSKKLEVSRHDLSALLNDVMQIKYYDYINQMRIEYACKLLKNNTKKEKNVIEIAYEVGYVNKATFNSVFKKLKNCTPTEYRENNIADTTLVNATQDPQTIKTDH